MEELIESICDYVKKPYTDYAVMLNGEWGSGKTYFWNNKLRSRLEAVKINGKNYKTIYMSLYGINSLEEISKKIFIETNPMISKTLKKFVDTRQGNLIPEYVKTGLDMANLFGSMNFNSDKVDFSKLFAIDDKILCFDDLERANVDVIDILGYINNFVEHDGIKTILICNEKELATKFKNNNIELKALIATYILDKEGNLINKGNVKNFKNEDKLSNNDLANQLHSIDRPMASLIEEKVSDIFDKSNAYERIKEKLIGETFEYVPEYAYILSGMMMKFSYNDALYDFYKRNTSLIIAAFKKSDTRNLRILKHALNDFEKIFNMVLDQYPNTDLEMLKTMLTFTVAVSFEIKTGNKAKEKLKSIKDNDEYNSVIFTSKILNDSNQFYLREFDNNYFLNNQANYKFFKFIETYIRTRFFDEKIFKENMSVANKEFIDNSQDSSELKYETILDGSYWKLSDFDFDLLWRQVLEEVKEGKVEFREHVKLFAIFKYLIDSNLVNYELNELKQNFILGMKVSASNNLEAIVETFEDNDTRYDIEDVHIKEIKDEYLELKQRALEDLSAKKANELFKHLPNNLPEFYKLMIGEYKDLPVFSKYDMEDLYNKLSLTPNYDLYNIINLVQERYRKNKNIFELDYPNLKKLCNIIHKNKTQTDKTIKHALLENLSKTVNKINMKIMSKKKKVNKAQNKNIDNSVNTTENNE